MLLRSPSSARERTRRSRQRKRRGVISVRLDVPEVEIIEALIVSERLSESDTRDRRLVERELSIVLADWAKRWAKIV